MRALFAKIVTTLIGAGLMMTATAALACNTGCPTPPPTPPSSCGCETGGNGGGHGGGHHGHGGGNNSSDVNVNVNVQTSTDTTTSASARAAIAAWSTGAASSSASATGAGYSNWTESAGTPQNAGALNVETGQGGAAFDMISERRTVTRTLVLQASCIDDTGVPHPASQVSAERAIANEYMGEVYRCIAGTHMQVTMADFGICDDFGGAAGATRVAESETSSYSRSESHSSSGYESGYQGGGYQDQSGQMDAGPCSPQAVACSASGGYAAQGGSYQGGESHDVAHEVSEGGASRRAGCAANMDLTHVNFDGGKTMTCQKGDALWFDHGNLTCKVQIAQRQCNERSLLRRFGVGLKVLTVTRVETTQRQVARQVERTSSTSTTMTFDGGVGGFVE